MTIPSQSSAAACAFTDEEAITIITEFEKGCGCIERCYEQFSVSEVKDLRLNMMELSKTEHDILQHENYRLLIRDPLTVSHACSSKAAKKKRLTTDYAFDHRSVCQKAFCFLHCSGEFTLRILRKHLIEIGPVPREHGSKGHKAYNAYPLQLLKML